MITHVALPAKQAAPITTARYSVTSSRDFTSQAAGFLTVKSKVTIGALCQCKDDCKKLMAFQSRNNYFTIIRLILK